MYTFLRYATFYGSTVDRLARRHTDGDKAAVAGRDGRVKERLHARHETMLF